MGKSNYPNFHHHKSSWSYSGVYNVGLFFKDFEEQLNKENIYTAKSLLRNCLSDFYFNPVTLYFGNVQLTLDNIDDAATTLDELEKAEDRFIKLKY